MSAKERKKLHVIVLLFAIAIPLVVGAISATLTSDSMLLYAAMDKPPLAPPAMVFPIAWTILYILMGLASYFAYTSTEENGPKLRGLVLYALQLIMNFCWSIVFFNWQMYLLAFIWLVVMLIIIIMCTRDFFKLSFLAGLMMLPYICWMIFAGYLNLASYIIRT